MKTINRVTSKTAVSGVSNAFELSKKIEIDMDMFPPEQPFEGFISDCRTGFEYLSGDESNSPNL